ncbi:MAG: excisionase, partial [Pantoea sp.]|nr:excisionase [Pantoea sp.]
MGQLIPIKEWATGPNGFRYPPKPVTLNTYAKTGQIYPQPIKQGRCWVVDEHA